MCHTTLSFRSGNVNVDRGLLRNIAYFGYEWSSQTTVLDDGPVYSLGFNKSDVFPSDSHDRWIASPLRCLARDYTFDTKSMPGHPHIYRGVPAFS